MSGGSLPSSRPPLERMLRIHELLMAGGYPNCARMSVELEVSSKTVQRDIDFMRDRLSLPIGYERVEHGFYYTEPVSGFPTVMVSEGELVALLVAQKAMEQYRGTAFEKPLASAFSKIAAGLHEETGVSFQDLSEAFSFRPSGQAVTELDTFQTLAEAVVAEEGVEFDYRSLRGDAPERRRVRPYHLGCLANQWYLIAHDESRKGLRTFALSRLGGVARTGQHFRKPKNFSVSQILSGSFSAFQTTDVAEVRLRLDPLAARLAAERRWHASQELHPLRGGGAELTLRVSVAPDLINWILGWGEHAEVVAPASLRRTIAAEVRAMAAAYAAD